MIAHRLRRELDAGRAARDIVVLVRATASLRLFEEALEEQGVPTYVVGGRGYWSQQPVRDGLAYLSALANPLDEEALLGVLASPFCGVGSDALILLSQGEAVWADAALGRAGRRPRARSASGCASSRRSSPPSASTPSSCRSRCCSSGRSRRTGYDLAVLARSGGERRLANLRKLMRLAREYERAEGRDLRGFLAYAATRDVAAAREGEAPLESEGLDAVRLMTIHRAKGLEFPVVCVADLGRQGRGRTERLLLGADGSVGLRLSTPGSGGTVPALAFERLAAEAAEEEDAEERRLFYVAMTRACDRLILSGTADPEKQAAAPPRRAAAGLDRARARRRRRGRGGVSAWSTACSTAAPRASSPASSRPPRSRPTRSSPAPATGTPGTALPARPKVVPAPSAGRPAPQRLSYTALGQYAKCPYRFYLQRSLRLPPVTPPSAARRGTPEAERPALDPRVRGMIAHRLLEELDFARPRAAAARGRAGDGRRVGRGADRRPGRGHPRDRRRVRRLAAVRAASPRPASSGARRRSRSRSTPPAARS